MRPALLSLVLVSPLVGASIARADEPVANAVVTLTPDGQAFATRAGVTPQQLQDQITSRVEDAYQTNNVAGFLRSFTNATSFSNRGLGVDYASASDDFMIGFAGNVAVSSPDVINQSDHPTGGGAANFGIMIGGNLKGMGLPRVSLFANGFYESAATDKLAGDLTSAGAHVQYRLVQPESDGGAAVALRWIGIDLTTGLEYTRWTLGVKDTIKDSYVVGAGSMQQTLSMSSTGTFDLTSNALTIPLEATTGFRILELLSVYVGGGIDFTAGKTSIDANLDGAVKATDVTDVGNVKITASGSNTGSPAAFRALAGVQVNLWRLKVFAQGNLSQNSTASVSFGLRLLL